MIEVLKRDGPQLLSQRPKIIWGLKKWGEHKSLWQIRFNYLLEQGILPDNPDLREKMTALSKLTKGVFNLFSRFIHSSEPAYLDKARNKLAEAANIEIEMLNGFCELIIQTLKNKLIRW